MSELKVKPVELTERQVQCLITTLEETLNVLENPSLAKRYREILKKLYASYEK